MAKRGALLGLFSYVAAIAVVMSLSGFTSRSVPASESPTVISLGTPMGVNDLLYHFEQHNYFWPPESGVVPAVVTRALPGDIVDVSHTAERKSLFLQTLLPIVLLENQGLDVQRRRVEQLFSRGVAISRNKHAEWLYDLAARFKVKGDLNKLENRRLLLRRLDVIPPALVLAQAAIESGWGTSRFAQQGNSLFGQWSYSKNTGLVPEGRDEGASHVVKHFESLQASVRSYMRNLNTHNAYRDLRLLREEMRKGDEALDAMKLAEGLILYSQRREEYVAEVQAIIRINQLNRLNDVELGG